MWNKFLKWWYGLFHDQYELTIYFPDQVVELPDGSKKAGFNPKTYKVKILKKVDAKHFIFIDLDGCLNEIKVVNPVGYDLKKLY
jgi:hypothetical protein